MVSCHCIRLKVNGFDANIAKTDTSWIVLCKGDG